jgi:hypothetical protein
LTHPEKSVKIGVDDDGKNEFHLIYTFTRTLYELNEDFYNIDMQMDPL